jgi:cell division ATPase FtsA
MALRTPTKDAEDIKVESGFAKQLLADPNVQVEVPGLGDRGPRMLSRQNLAGVIEPRIEEIFSLVQQVLRDSGYEEVLSSGIVLTGGSAMMPGMIELGEDIFLESGAPWCAALQQRFVRHGVAPACGHRHGLVGRSPHGAFARISRGAKKWFCENRHGAGQGLVCGELLIMNKQHLQTVVRSFAHIQTHRRWRPCIRGAPPG